MAFITREELKKYAPIEAKSTYFTKTASQILNESAMEFSVTKTYDIFLSHSYSDADEILRVKRMLESYNYSVYVDWVDDAQLNRNMVTTKTAELLKERMNTSTSLVYVTSENSSDSKWMQWELGYFDALKQKVAILPILADNSKGFKGLEYLGLYPYVDRATFDGTSKQALWVNDDNRTYISFDAWLKGKKPYKRGE